MGSFGGSQGFGGGVVQADKSTTSASSVTAQSSVTNRRCALRLDDCLSTPNSRRCRVSLVNQFLFNTILLLCVCTPRLNLPGRAEASSGYQGGDDELGVHGINARLPERGARVVQWLQPGVALACSM